MPQITPIAGPASVQSSTAPSSAQLDARARAIARLTVAPEATTQPTPVPNPTRVSPEEMGAIRHGTTETPGQTSKSDTPGEQPAVPKEATAPEEVPLSSQYAQLARHEKRIRAQANAVKAQETALKAREDAIKAKEAEMQGDKYVPRDVLAKDPIKVLQDQGFTSEQITQMLLNAPSPEAQQQQAVIERLEAKIKALEDGQESAKKNLQETQSQQYQEVISQLRREASTMVSSNPEFETIKATNSVDDVVELITKTFEKEGTLLTVEEAAQAVEEYLVDEALKVARLNKIQARLKPSQQGQPAATQQTTAKPTLTNRMGTTAKLSAKERAVLAFNGQLK